MRAVFIADAHLRRPEDRNYRELLAFLEEQEGRTDLLIILGDLFEFWIGYPERVFPHYRPVLDRLVRLGAGGTRIIYCEGNHDFHLGPFFEGTLGAEVHPGPAVLTLNGTRILICHGDEIDRRDLPLRVLRTILHGPLVKALIPLTPASVAFAIAERLSRLSTRHKAKKKRRRDRSTMIREFAAEWFSKGCDAVVTGHFHLPFLETSADGSRTILSLGDWITSFSYGEYTDATFFLKSYPSSTQQTETSPDIPKSSR